MFPCIKEESPLISVILPVYNVAAYLPICLDSLINQTYKNLEIILINDGSTDNSLAICQQYARQDNRIKVISQKNAGCASARNAGLKIAKGEYIGFVDPDDKCEPELYENLLAYILRDNADISMCDYHIINCRSTKVLTGVSRAPSTEGIFSADFLLEHFFMLAEYLWNKLFKRELIIGKEFVNGMHNCSDGLFMAELYSSANPVVSFSPKKLYVYFERKNSISFSHYRISHKRNYFKLLDLIIDYAKTKNNKKLEQVFILRKLNYIVELLVCVAKGQETITIQDQRSLALELKQYSFIFLPKIKFLKRRLFLIICWINLDFALKIVRFFISQTRA